MLVPLVVDFRGDFGGFDFGSAAPEDVGVRDGDADGFEVFVDGGFVFEDTGFFGAVDYAHDVDVAELGSAFAPVAMGHAVVASDFGACFDFAAFGDGPVEEAVEAGDAFAGFGGGFDVFEEGGEASDDFFGVEGFGDFAESVEGKRGEFGASGPRVFVDFIEGEFFFEDEEDFPFFWCEFGGDGGHHDGGGIGFVTGFEGAAADVADAECEDAVGGHEEVFGGSGEFEEFGGVVVEGFADGDFEGGPEAVSGAGDFGVGGANDDVAGEGVVFRHEVEGVVEFFLGDFPCDKCAVGEFSGEQGLADTADDAGFLHGADAGDDGVEGDVGFFRDELEGVALEAGNEVFGDGEDFGVGFVGDGGRCVVGHGGKMNGFWRGANL